MEEINDSTKKQKKRKKKKPHRFFWRMIKLQIVLMMIVLGCFGYYYFGGYAKEVSQLKSEAVKLVENSNENTFIPSQTSTIYDCKGQILTELKGEKGSDYVSYENIPANFVAAIISIEDKKYYNHSGVDYRAVFRAVKAMIQNGKVTQGGSTITMQLAKLIYMESSQTWQYKVEQMWLALELEKRYSKNKIMEFYLNNIYFANNYYGVQAACHGYFNCELNELSLSQIAFLLAIPNSPTYYDPVVNIEHTLERRNLILDNLLEDEKITQEQYDAAIKEEIKLNRPKVVESKKHNYVDTYVYYCATRSLMEQKGFQFRYDFDSEEEEQAYDESYDQVYADCYKEIFSGGYKIYTSIDMDKQEKLQDTVDAELEEFTDTNEDGTYAMQGAAVCIDNETGLVVAIVGGREQNFSTYTLNRAYQSHRQPGSSIKPLVVYTPMFERGYTPDTKVEDKKIEDGPSNSSGSYMGKVSVRTAIAKSLNTVAWQLYDELTPKKGLAYLKEMDFRSIVETDNTLATSLGGFTKGVSPLEMAAAYAALENDGVFKTPSCISSIIDRDENIIYTADNTGKVVYEQTAARMMTDCMTTVMESGTGKSVRLSDMPCAGKTGTTNSQKDGWFVGFTRYYTTSVWVGYDYPKEVKDLTGSSYPGRIWNTYMEQIHEGLVSVDFLPYVKISEDYQKQKEEEKKQQEEKREEANQNNEGNSKPTKKEEEKKQEEQTDKKPQTPEESSNPQEEEEELPEVPRDEPQTPQEEPLEEDLEGDPEEGESGKEPEDIIDIGDDMEGDPIEVIE